MVDEEHAEAEGWYTDPFGRHDARWMSAGRPTKLVRDGDDESYDDPPDEPWSQPLAPFAAAPDGDEGGPPPVGGATAMQIGDAAVIPIALEIGRDNPET